jgi:predicted nuclease of predicted toxin-antitoxin system
MMFLADMGVSMKIVSWLREQGHDIFHLHELGMQKAKDSVIFEKAYQEDRIILTMDLDFTDILALTASQFPSVILFRLTDQQADNIIQKIKYIIKQHSNILETGAVISVGDRSIRVRELPL